jgi:hypothetical protein
VYRHWVLVVQQLVLKKTAKEILEEKTMLMIVGQISSPEEANEIEFITKNFVVANRAKQLARSIRSEQN